MTYSTSDMHAALTELAAEINRLRPDWRNAQDFYELRSQIAGRLRSLAASPLATRTVVRPIRVEVPVEVRVKIPAPAPAPPLGDGYVVMLNADELAALFHRTYERGGGYQNRTRKWQTRVDRATGRLVLDGSDLMWAWRQASREWKGGFQRRVRKMIWRPLGEFFTALGLKPSVATHLPTMTGRRPGKPWLAPKYLREPPDAV
jgi:hypothetical protein